VSNVTVILAVIALGCFVASLLPMIPEKYASAVGGILLAVALIVSQRA
jgi:hypothetical protein